MANPTRLWFARPGFLERDYAESNWIDASLAEKFDAFRALFQIRLLQFVSIKIYVRPPERVLDRGQL